MIKHIVCWTFAESAQGRSKAENVERVAAQLRALPSVITGINAFEVIVPQDGLACSYDLALYSEFTDEEALVNYGAHPDHMAVAELITNVRTDRGVIDYDTDALIG